MPSSPPLPPPPLPPSLGDLGDSMDISLAGQARSPSIPEANRECMLIYYAQDPNLSDGFNRYRDECRIKMEVFSDCPELFL